MLFILMFVWHAGATFVGDEACALLFLCLCGAAALLLFFNICFWRGARGRWAQGGLFDGMIFDAHAAPALLSFGSLVTATYPLLLFAHQLALVGARYQVPLRDP